MIAECRLATLTLMIATSMASSLPGFIPPTQDEPAEKRPNVVVFLSDDQGFGDFSMTGNRDLQTPHIDSLARDGALVERFYVCPVCSPTRAEFLTGRYHVRGGVYSTSAGGERLDLDETTIAQVFQSAGYRTAAFGKWHNGMQPPYHPNARGFELFYGFCSGHWGNYFSPILERNNQLVRGKGFVIDDFTSQAIEFIQQHRDEPFFVYLPYCTPHSPMQVPDPYWENYRDREIQQSSSRPGKEDLGHTRAALAMCANIDDNVGRVLETLEKLNLSDQTIVMYFCDNGPNGWRYNAGLKGRKGSTDEGGVRSPLFVRWPMQIPAGVRPQQIAGAIDLLPTLVDFCGIEMELNKPLDGVSIAADLRGQAKPRDRVLFSHWKDRVSVRDQRFLLDQQGQLFDLQQDPAQSKPVKLPQQRQRLQDAVAKFRSDVLTELNAADDRPFPVGHANFPATQLPARDATATGKIERSNRFPNCSFFRNWVNQNDTISWPVDVLTTGRYQVDLYYCCEPDDVGTVMHLSLADQRITKTIDQAHTSKLIGAEQDRTPRMESYVKDFRPVDMGTIALPAGPGNLTLSTSAIPGDASIEFRMLVLTRIKDTP